MNYQEFSKFFVTAEPMLCKIGSIVKKKMIVSIDIDPDYDISEYQYSNLSSYYFYNYWDFSNDFNSILECKFIENHIFDSNEIQGLCHAKNLNIKKNEYSLILNEIYSKYRDDFYSHSFDSEVGEFKLNKVRYRSVDNIKRRLHYEGSFQGTSIDIGYSDARVFSIICVLATPKNLEKLPFYKRLLAESYLLLKERSFKLSYFLFFTAFENFVNNYIVNDDENIRLKEKLNKVYKEKFNELSNHQIYTSIITELSLFEEKRNCIAHGNESIIIDEESVHKLLMFITILILTYEYNCEKFDELKVLLI